MALRTATLRCCSSSKLLCKLQLHLGCVSKSLFQLLHRAAQLLAAGDAVRCAMAHTFAQLQLYLATGVVTPALEALQGELRAAKTLEEVRIFDESAAAILQFALGLRLSRQDPDEAGMGLKFAGLRHKSQTNHETFKQFWRLCRQQMRTRSAWRGCCEGTCWQGDPQRFGI